MPVLLGPRHCTMSCEKQEVENENAAIAAMMKCFNFILDCKDLKLFKFDF